MVYVKLAQDWTDQHGARHAAGGMVDVDAGTLAELEAAGTVSEPDPPEDDDDDQDGDEDPDGGWAGPG